MVSAGFSNLWQGVEVKLIGHVSVAALATAPLIHYRGVTDNWGMPQLSDWQLLAWVGFWAVLPDVDIILSRFLPIKHRGFLTHSLYSALAGMILVLAGWLLTDRFSEQLVGWNPELFARLQPLPVYLGPFTALLAGISLILHVLGDSLTKSGVPLWRPDQEWHFPLIGGYAVYDNYALNAIPLALAGYVLAVYLGFKPTSLKRLGHLSDLWKLPAASEPHSSAKARKTHKRKSASASSDKSTQSSAN